jgi:uncharacterized protein (TIGR02284 family)
VATITNSIKDTLNKLIRLCRDGEQGFAAAAEAIDSDELKKELLRHSRERAGFAAALAGAMAERGYICESHGSAPCAFDRGWNSSAITPGDYRQAALAACERGENSAAEAYADAMTAPLPGRIADLMSIQYPVVKATHSRIRSLRDAADPNSVRHFPASWLS